MTSEETARKLRLRVFVRSKSYVKIFVVARGKQQFCQVFLKSCVPFLALLSCFWDRPLIYPKTQDEVRRAPKKQPVAKGLPDPDFWQGTKSHSLGS